jgi:hypothetical protein
MPCGRNFISWNIFPQFPRLATDGRIPGGFAGFIIGTTILNNLSVLAVFAFILAIKRKNKKIDLISFS